MALGSPTRHPSAGCTSAYSLAPPDRSMPQRPVDRPPRHRRWTGRLGPSSERMADRVSSELATAAGITLGGAMADAEHAYPSWRQNGTDFWRTIAQASCRGRASKPLTSEIGARYSERAKTRACCAHRRPADQM